MTTTHNGLAVSKDTISFGTNWNNKLACSAFTTLRLANPDKYQIGRQYNIVLHSKKKADLAEFPAGRPLFKAIIIDIKVYKLNQITNWVSLLDTGLPKDECQAMIKKMYSKSISDWNTQEIFFILLLKLK